MVNENLRHTNWRKQSNIRTDWLTCPSTYTFYTHLTYKNLQNNSWMVTAYQLINICIVLKLTFNNNDVIRHLFENVYYLKINDLKCLRNL